jgi:hypothetical protein
MSSSSKSVIYVYIGRQLLGTVGVHESEYEARNAKHKLIGRFPTVRKAADAISDRYREQSRDG